MRDLLCLALVRAVDLVLSPVSRMSERTTRALEQWLDMDTPGQCTHPGRALTTQGTHWLRCGDCGHHFTHPLARNGDIDA